MNLETLFRDRRTIHWYRPDPLPDGALERALVAANWAPCHKLTFPWRFLRMGPETRALVEQVAVRVKLGDDRTPRKLERLYKRWRGPAEMLAVVQVVSPDPAREREDYAALAMAVQNFQLSMWAEGVGCKWSTGRITRDPELLGAFQLQEGEACRGFLWVGTPDRLPGPPPRPAMDVVLRELP